MNIEFPEVQRINPGYSLNIIQTLNSQCKLSEEEIRQDLYKLHIPYAVQRYVINSYYGRPSDCVTAWWYKIYQYATSNPIQNIKEYNGIDDEYAIFPNYKNGQLVGYYKLKNPKLKEIK